MKWIAIPLILIPNIYYLTYIVNKYEEEIFSFRDRIIRRITYCVVCFKNLFIVCITQFNNQSESTGSTDGLAVSEQSEISIIQLPLSHSSGEETILEQQDHPAVSSSTYQNTSINQSRYSQTTIASLHFKETPSPYPEITNIMPSHSASPYPETAYVL